MSVLVCGGVVSWLDRTAHGATQHLNTRLCLYQCTVGMRVLWQDALEGYFNLPWVCLLSRTPRVFHLV